MASDEIIPFDADKPADPACGSCRDYIEYEAEAERHEQRHRPRFGELVHRYPGEDEEILRSLQKRNK